MPEIMNQSINKGAEILNSVSEVIKKSDVVYHPSLFWKKLNKINLEQLKLSLSRFKFTVRR